MEFKQLIAIFRKDLSFFVGLVLLVVIIALVWQRNQPPVSQATLLLNVGRTGTEQTSDYTYDSFYRLQADERFADTVVRWLSSPRVVEDIYKDARLNPESLGLRDLKKTFTAGRLSSQIIEVNFSNQNEKLLPELSRSAVTVLGRYTDSLNKENKEKNWFAVIGSDPVIRDGRVETNTALLLGLAIGLFIGFWGVLFRHYLRDN